MTKALHDITMARPEAGRRLDWRKKMSDHVAYALLIYTGLQIFVTMTALKSGHGGSILPYCALIVLVAAIIPGARWFEGRWAPLNDAQAADPALAHAFKRDRLALWLCAIGLPFGLTAIFKVVAPLF
jgi:hypothetical protein